MTLTHEQPQVLDPLDPGWRIVSDDGLISVRLDFEREDFWMDADFRYTQASMNHMIALLETIGLELIPAEECEPDIFDTHTRVYIARKYPRGNYAHTSIGVWSKELGEAAA